MLSRDEFLRQALPLLEAIELGLSDGAPVACVVVGPTPDELAVYVPDLANLVKSHSSSKVIPVEPGQPWDELLIADCHASLVDTDVTESGLGGGISPRSVVAIPPDCALDFSTMLAIGDPLLAELESADPGLSFLATRLGHYYQTVCATTENALIGVESHAARKHIYRSYGGRTRYSRAMLRRRGRELLTHSGPQPSILGARRQQVLDVWVARQLERRGFQSIEVGFVWRVDSLGSSNHDRTVCILGTTPGQSSAAVHCRSFSGEWATSLLRDQAFIDEVLAIAHGEGSRGEDDAFVPLDDFYASGDWRVGSRDTIGFRGLLDGLGYPLKRLGEIARIAKSTNEGSGNRVWMRTAGDGAGAVSRLPFDVGAAAVELEADDADMLFRILNDGFVQLSICCRGYGSLRAPTLPPSVIAETLIPWPSEEERRRLHSKMEESLKRVEAWTFAAESLEESLGEFEAEAKDGAPWMWAYHIGKVKEHAADIVDQISEEVLGVPRPKEGVTDPKGGVVLWPAPVAILRRRYQSEDTPATRLSRAIDLAETVIRYDVAVLLGILGHSHSGDRGRVLGEAAQSTRSGWAPSLGHWRAVQRSARRTLVSLVDGTDPRLEPVRVLARAACELNTRNLDRAADEIVKLRNQYRGHGFTPTPAQCGRVAAVLDGHLRELVGELTYISRHLLFRLDRVEKRRDRTSIQRLLLAHDNPEFERQSLERPSGSSFERHAVGEVYLDIDGNEILSLWPWVHVVDGPTGEPALALLDGIRSKRTVWNLPIDAAKQETDDQTDQIRKIVGLSEDR